MITVIEAAELCASRIVNKHTHKNYERVNNLRELYTQLITGEKQDDLIKQFFSTQSEEERKKIMTVTRPVTAAVCNSLQAAFKKVLRTNPIAKEIDFNEFTEEKKALVEGRKDKYFAGQSLDYYIEKRFHDLTFLDPNSFIVTEFLPFDFKNEKSWPFPLEVSSQQAVDYKKVNGVLQYLMAEYGLSFTDAEGKAANGVKIIIYLENYSIVFTQVAKTSNAQLGNDKYLFVKENITFNDNQTLENVPVRMITEDKEFIVTYYNHKTGRVPAESVGYVFDKSTDGQTFVSPIHYGAIDYLLKTIKTAAELDLTIHSHTFPRMAAYVEPCSVEANGKCASSGENVFDCKKCGGRGFQLPSSSKDITTLKLPRNMEDAIDLSKLIHYSYPPIEGIKFQEEYVEKLTQKCYKSVFNSDVFAKDEIAQTATGKNIDLQNVYDTLYDYGSKISNYWENTVRMIAVLVDITDCLPKLKFPKDFKMKSLSDLLADLKTATDSNAPVFIKNEIIKDISNQMFVDRPTEQLRIEGKQALYPFSGKTIAEINIGLNSGLALKRDGVLWMYYDRIMDDLEQQSFTQNNNFKELLEDDVFKQYQEAVKKGKLWFYDLPYHIKQALMYAMADKLATEIEGETATASSFSENGGGQA